MSVHLRPITSLDADKVLAWRNSPEVARHMYSDHVITANEHQAWLARVLASKDRFVWIVEWRSNPVGLAALNRVSMEARRYDWAFYLADPGVRGHGVGGCVEYLVLQYAFERLKGRKLWCEVLAENETVWRLHLSFGFTREADFRDHVLKGGRFRDVVGLGLLEEDWTRLKPSLQSRLTAKGLLQAAVVTSPARPGVDGSQDRP